MMELGNVMTQLAARPALYWIATAVLALGVSCLAASLIMFVRRLSAPASRIEPRVRSDRVAVDSRDTPAAPPPNLISPVTYENIPACQSQPDLLEDSSMAPLLQRLQVAGDRLEDIAGDLETMSAVSDESNLKARLPGVEYVFKATGA